MLKQLSDLTNPKVNVTYTKYAEYDIRMGDSSKPGHNPGRVFIGRSSEILGKSPCEIVKDRDKGAQHQLKNSDGYEKARLDRWTIATLPYHKRHKDPAYLYIRGREDAVINQLSGPITRQLAGTQIVAPYLYASRTRARNIIRGISEQNTSVLYPARTVVQLYDNSGYNFSTNSTPVNIYDNPNWNGVSAADDPCD